MLWQKQNCLKQTKKKNDRKIIKKKNVMKKKHKGNLWAENSAIQILLSLIFKSVNQLCQFHRVSLDVLKALKKISVDFIVQCV